MIVMDRQDSFLLFKQYDHGLASGDMARHWKDEYFTRADLRKDVEFAVANHDRAWIALDRNPLWNREKQQPYSFIDYPLNEKIKHYEQGIDEVQQRTNYGAALCSLHYTSFFPKDSSQSVISAFISREIRRRERIFGRMVKHVSAEERLDHFKLLQFCDDLSLYLCMNEPGVEKDQELSWFKDGFRQTFEFASEGMMARWEDQQTVTVTPFPFEHSFMVSIPFKNVYKKHIDEYGMKIAYEQGEEGIRNVLIKG